MPSLTPSIAAAIASIPGLALSYYLVSGRNMSSLEHIWSGFLAVATWLIPIYFVGALIYGYVLSIVLRAFGWLSLAAYLLGAILPVILYLVVDAMIRGYGSGTHVALFAFGLPCLVMGFVLWFFSVKGNLGA